VTIVSSARDATELDTPELIGRRAGERAVARLGSRKLTTRQAPLPIRPIWRAVCSDTSSERSGASQYRKASFLLNAAGEESFRHSCDAGAAALPQGLASAPSMVKGRLRMIATRARWRPAGLVLAVTRPRTLGLKTRQRRRCSQSDRRGARKAWTWTASSADEDGLWFTEMMGQG